MMGSGKRSFAPLTNVSLEDLVPADPFYRQLERTLDLSFVRVFVERTYAGRGRYSPLLYTRRCADQLLLYERWA
jgi:hypothetical protein